MGQTYVIGDDGSTYLYLLTVTGTDGVVGMSEASEKPAALTGSEAIDFPKQCQEWYAIDGNKVTGVTPTEEKYPLITLHQRMENRP